jgi:Methane oxygenase PmoA
MYRVILALWCATATASAAEQKFELTIKAGKHDRKNVVVCVPMQLPVGTTPANIAHVTLPDGKTVSAQVTAPSLTTASIAAETGKERGDLWFVLPSLKAGESVKATAEIRGGSGAAMAAYQFWWKQGETEDTLTLSTPDKAAKIKDVLRYVHPKLDESNGKAREETFKVYHHVYSPDGNVLLTKGVGGLYTHHRGIFYGFMKVTHDGVTDDIWHCKGDACEVHEKVLAESAGTELGRHRVQIAWIGKGKKPFATEQRELTVYNVPGGRLIEFASLLTPTGTIKLDGDPQHAGFHFRAVQEVAEKTAKQTIYIRPDGTDKPGATRNWDSKGNKKHINLPWNGMSFVVGGKRYTAAYLDRPTNPKEARFSERDYGRFGSYFVKEVTPEKPLLVNYRIWIQDGQMTGEEIARLDTDFVEPVEVEVK